MRPCQRGLSGNAQGGRIRSSEIIIPRGSVWIEERQREGEGKDESQRRRHRQTEAQTDRQTEKEQPPLNGAVFWSLSFPPSGPPARTGDLSMLRLLAGSWGELRAEAKSVGFGGGQPTLVNRLSYWAYSSWITRPSFARVCDCGQGPSPLRASVSSSTTWNS